MESLARLVVIITLTAFGFGFLAGFITGRMTR